MGATQASAGVLAPYIEARDGGPLLEPTARTLTFFAFFVSQLVEAGGAATSHRGGPLAVARRGAWRRQLSATATILAARGIEAELLDADAIRRHEPELS